MFPFRRLLGALTALILLSGVMALPARVATPRNAGLQHRATDGAPNLLVAFDGDDDDVTGYEQPALLPAAAVRDLIRIRPAALQGPACRGGKVRVADRRLSTLVGTIVLLI